MEGVIHQLNLRELSSGLYFLRLDEINGSIFNLINKNHYQEYTGIKLIDHERELENIYGNNDGYIQTQYGQTFYGMDLDTLVELPIPEESRCAEYFAYQMINSDGSLKYKELAKINYTGSDSLYKYATLAY